MKGRIWGPDDEATQCLSIELHNIDEVVEVVQALEQVLRLPKNQSISDETRDTLGRVLDAVKGARR